MGFRSAKGIPFVAAARSRTEIRGGQKKVMRLWIDAHRASAKLGLEGLYFRELDWCILVEKCGPGHRGWTQTTALLQARRHGRPH